jgi:hypothetical protein
MAGEPEILSPSGMGATSISSDHDSISNWKTDMNLRGMAVGHFSLEIQRRIFPDDVEGLPAWHRKMVEIWQEFLFGMQSLKEECEGEGRGLVRKYKAELRREEGDSPGRGGTLIHNPDGYQNIALKPGYADEDWSHILCPFIWRMIDRAAKLRVDKYTRRDGSDIPDICRVWRGYGAWGAGLYPKIRINIRNNPQTYIVLDNTIISERPNNDRMVYQGYNEYLWNIFETKSIQHTDSRSRREIQEFISFVTDLLIETSPEQRELRTRIINSGMTLIGDLDISLEELGLIGRRPATAAAAEAGAGPAGGEGGAAAPPPPPPPPPNVANVSNPATLADTLAGALGRIRQPQALVPLTRTGSSGGKSRRRVRIDYTKKTRKH